MKNPFAGKTVLITGASSGIGAELAKAFARGGASLILMARRLDRLQLLSEEIKKESAEKIAKAPLLFQVDVTDFKKLKAITIQLQKKISGIDYLIANAGYSVVGNVNELPLQSFRDQFETNVFSVVEMSKLFFPLLKKRSGKLALVGSVAAHTSSPGNAAYNMSKFSLRALAQSLEMEWLEHGVKVALITPGFVSTEIRKVDNAGSLDLSRQDPIPNWIRISPAKAAAIIVRGLRTNRREIIFPFHAKVAVFLSRFFPSLMRSFFISEARRIPAAHPTPKKKSSRPKKR
jgi:short-subunit dehydrogenase